MWGGADYEGIVERYAPIYDELVGRLGPRAGERWLDVATGTGEIALRAAAAGADVVGVDIAPKLLEQAARKARERDLAITFDLGNAEALDYADGEFDVVASNFGAIMAPDHGAVARELGRVCRPGGRLGMTAWRPKPELTAIYERFRREAPAADIEAWGRDGRAAELLVDSFELEIHDRVWHLTGDSAEAVYEFWSQVAPPTKAYLESLDDDTRKQVRAALLDYWSRYRRDDGSIAEPRAYLLILGRRR